MPPHREPRPDHGRGSLSDSLFNEIDFSDITVNGEVFDDFSPYSGDDTGLYTVSALDNGGFTISD